MRLADVMDEIASVLSQITGLRVEAYPADSLSPPAAAVSYPASIDYDETYGRGEDQFTDLPFIVVAGEATTRSSRDLLSEWTAGDGPRSVKRVMESRVWTSCDDVHVSVAEIAVVKVAGVELISALFKATVVGPGGN